MTNSIFSPSFGNRPSQLVGRDREISSVIEGLKSIPGSRDRATIILGQRGMGKTVLLLELAERAKKENYIVASPTIVSEDMLERVIEKIQTEGEKLLKDRKTKVSGGNIGFLGFSAGLQFDRDGEEAKSFTYKITKLTEALNKEGKGVLILIDELQANNTGLKQLIIAYQEMVGAGLDVAIAFAGLPGAVSKVLNDKVLTFLNRANKIPLERLDNGDIDAYFMHAFDAMGIELSAEQRDTAVKATNGSPYMMQLVGYYIAKYAIAEGQLAKKEFEAALKTAEEVFVNDICGTTLNSLSDKDIVFLKAMMSDGGTSRIADISKRMNVSNEYAQRYKNRLIEAGVIVQPRRGEVRYDIPFLADYLELSKVKDLE